MFCFPRPIFALAAAGLLVGCTQPPEIPEGRRPPEHAIQQVLLGDELNAKDVKRIFSAVNTDGALDTLKPWVEIPDEELQPLMDVFSEHVYADAHSAHGIVGALAARSRAGKFTAWANNSETWKLEKNALDETRFLSLFMQRDTFPFLAQRGVGFFSDDFVESLTALDEGQRAAPPAPERNTLAIVRDVKRWLTEAGFTPPMRTLHAVERGNLVAAGLTAAVELLRKQSLPGLREPRSAEREIQAAVKKLLPEKPGTNEGERLLRFITASAGTTGELFRRLEEGLRVQSEGLSARTHAFDTLFTRSAAGFIREELEIMDAAAWEKIGAGEAPSPEFRVLYGAIREGIESLTGEAVGISNADHVITNLPIYANALAIARWFRATMPANLPRLAGGQYASIWDVPWTAPEITVNLREKVGGVWRVHPSALKELDGETKAEFRAGLELLVQKAGTGNFNYTFAEADGTQTLREVFGEVVAICHERRSFGDPEPVMRALLYRLTRPGEGLLISDLDSVSLLDSLNRLMGAIDLKVLRKFKRILFEEVKLGDLPEGVRKQLRAWIGNDAQLAARLDELLATVSVFQSLDENEHEATPLEAYHTLLRSMPAESLPSLRVVLETVAESRLFSVDAETKGWRFPAIVKWFRGGLDHGLGSLGHFQRWQIRAFAAAPLRLLETRGDVQPVPALAATLRDALLNHPLAVASLLGRDFSLQGGLTRDERGWLTRLLLSNGFETGWEFFMRHGDSQSAKALFESLLRLQAEGKVRSALELFGYARDERLRAIGDVLLEMEKSGEFKALCTTLRNWFDVSIRTRSVAN